MSTPRSMELEITGKCNLRCRYCSHFDSPGDVGIDLPAEEWLKFFEELNRCAVIRVCFSGGEPFCREDLRELIEGAVRNRMRYRILTNGTLISEEIAEFLASTKRCESIQVSIDGSSEEINDSFRGRGTFKKAMRGIEFLKSYGLPVTVRVTIHKKNLEDLENIAKLLLDDLQLPSFSTNSASYMGLCRTNPEEIQLTAKEQTRAMETLLILDKKYKDRIMAMAGPLAEAKIWSEMEESRCMNLPSKNYGGHLTGCGCVRRELAVRSDGIIVPCTILSHIELGRINRDDLRTIWRHHPALRSLRDRTNISLQDYEFCKGCAYIEYCTGSCPAMAYNLIGQVNHPSPDSCLRRFLEEGGRLPEIPS
ncbi:MAG: SynChlorMet cassette radical SAM/SPASM protein ScmE [Methanotrichaceae archaeon]|nr:SynChlorMet cassette radical SAM/SPASM protein ScmE [Methanotrichaceae archaeon]